VESGKEGEGEGKEGGESEQEGEESGKEGKSEKGGENQESKRGVSNSRKKPDRQGLGLLASFRNFHIYVSIFSLFY